MLEELQIQAPGNQAWGLLGDVGSRGRVLSKGRKVGAKICRIQPELLGFSLLAGLGIWPLQSPSEVPGSWEDWDLDGGPRENPWHWMLNCKHPLSQYERQLCTVLTAPNLALLWLFWARAPLALKRHKGT